MAYFDNKLIGPTDSLISDLVSDVCVEVGTLRRAAEGGRGGAYSGDGH